MAGCDFYNNNVIHVFWNIRVIAIDDENLYCHCSGSHAFNTKFYLRQQILNSLTGSFYLGAKE
jgi:hypothetical protein